MTILYVKSAVRFRGLPIGPREVFPCSAHVGSGTIGTGVVVFAFGLRRGSHFSASRGPQSRSARFRTSMIRRRHCAPRGRTKRSTTGRSDTGSDPRRRRSALFGRRILGIQSPWSNSVVEISASGVSRRCLGRWSAACRVRGDCDFCARNDGFCCWLRGPGGCWVRWDADRCANSCCGACGGALALAVWIRLLLKKRTI